MQVYFVCDSETYEPYGLIPFSTLDVAHQACRKLIREFHHDYFVCGKEVFDKNEFKFSWED